MLRGITIRQPRLEEAAVLLDLGRRILSETPFFLREPDERAQSEADIRTILQHYDRTPGWCMLHAWNGDIPLGEGVISGTGLRRSAHIGSIGIGVLKEYWGQGVGAALMQKLEEKAVEMGLERLSFTVFAENRRARDFYERLGYAEEGIQRKSVRWPQDHPGKPRCYSDEIAMAKWIGGQVRE